MHMQQSVKELLYSLPIGVAFQGFRGTTTGLAQHGWDLSMKQEYNMYHDFEMQLALRHGNRDFALYALSHPLKFHHGEEREFMMNPMAHAKFFANYTFEIAYISNDIRFQIMPHRGFSMAQSFEAIDPFPSERIEESIKDFKFFKVANPERQELIVTPEKVPEILDMILRAQSQTQEEIKARAKTRENHQRMRDGLIAKPPHTVEAQIISLAI